MTEGTRESIFWWAVRIAIVVVWLWWVVTATACASEPDQTPDAASGYPWCADLGCPKIHEFDRACGATRVCYCQEQRCEPVSPLRDNE